MQKGTVKWFNERAGLRTLNEGQEIEYELVTNRGRTSAENLKVA